MNFVLMKIQTASVRTRFFVHFIVLWISLQTRHNSTWDFQKTLKLKDDAVLTILDPIVMSHHTSVSNCFYYVVTIASSLLTDQIV